MGDKKPTDFASYRKRREKERYAQLVLKTYADFEHADNRKTLDRKAEVQIKGRERL